MGCPVADPGLVTAAGDPVEPADVAEVDEQAGLGQPELDQRQEAEAAREDLRLALVFLQDPERLAEIGGPHVLERGRESSLDRPPQTLRPAEGRYPV